MTDESSSINAERTIATIENKDNPSQSIDLKYLSDENAFVTSGIQTYFGEKEIFIPSQLVVINFDLIGAIVSTILENISKAQEAESTFEYPPSFKVLGNKYSMAEYGEYMKLVQKEDEEEK